MASLGLSVADQPPVVTVEESTERRPEKDEHLVSRTNPSAGRGIESLPADLSTTVKDDDADKTVSSRMLHRPMNAILKKGAGASCCGTGLPS